MAWRRPGDKPFSEPMMVRLPIYICVTRPQWFKAWCTVHCEIRGMREPQGSVGAPGTMCLVHWCIRVAPECLWCLIMHSTSYSNPIMTWISWFYEDEIMHCRKSMHDLFGHVHSNAFVTSKWSLCHQIYTKHGCKFVNGKYFVKIFFLNHPSTNVYKITYISNTNPSQFCKK